ncbi:methyltransferase family protein [Streptosporangium sp. CA-135522]|uniref:methyltransferase family protein n=1 Tax=Streptosporangium sp. CA-135522 TaxID=3240072 RepID=UPI003D8A83CC
MLRDAAQHDRLAATGPYAWVRHPQYDGFILIMIGFLLQWPTIPTLIMFPILVLVYARLARSEEHEVAIRYRDQWEPYAARTPTFWLSCSCSAPRGWRCTDRRGGSGSVRPRRRRRRHSLDLL